MSHKCEVWYRDRAFTCIHISYEVPFVSQQIMNIRTHWARNALFKAIDHQHTYTFIMNYCL